MTIATHQYPTLPAAPPARAPLLAASVEAAYVAGESIMKVYAEAFSVEYKADDSPLTAADRAAHADITAVLAKTNLPIMSEESAQAPYATRRHWPAFLLVDPLDGTKEFVKRNDEFTVNIALIENGQPVLGVVYAPALQDGYIGLAGVGAFRSQQQQPFTALPDRPAVDGPLRVVASRSHPTPDTEAFVARLTADGRPVERVTRGSALKLCMVAAGAAHCYPRLAPTMEWDTAAAQAVLNSVGGQVVVYDDAARTAFMANGLPALSALPQLTYNRADLVNPWFVALHPGVL